MGANYGCGDYECITAQDEVSKNLNGIRLSLMENDRSGDDYEWIIEKLSLAMIALEKNAHTRKG